MTGNYTITVKAYCSYSSTSRHMKIEMQSPLTEIITEPECFEVVRMLDYNGLYIQKNYTLCIIFIAIMNRNLFYL